MAATGTALIRCTKCGRLKPLDAFPLNGPHSKNGRNYRRPNCKPCHRAAQRAYWLRTSTVEKRREIHLRQNYGLTEEDVTAMAAAQQGKCAICGSEGGARGLFIDHDHATGRVRGLLCHRCNMGLGWVEDPVWTESARSYLRGKP